MFWLVDALLVFETEWQIYASYSNEIDLTKDSFVWNLNFPKYMYNI